MLISQLLRNFHIIGGKPGIEWQGGETTRACVRQLGPTVLVYGPAIALDASLGNIFQVTVTDGVAFAFSAPTNPPAATFDQEIAIRIINASGGAAGVGTWNAAFKTDGNVPAIANGFSRTFGFIWDGAHWIETYQSAADVAN